MTITCSVGSQQSREQSDAYIPSIFSTVLWASACKMVWAIPENNITKCYLLSNASVIKTNTHCMPTIRSLRICWTYNTCAQQR